MSTHPSPARGILITGASSGLGKALALACAQKHTHLLLAGRDEERLEQTAQACRERGALTETAALDVTDAEAMHNWITQTDQRTPIDLVIANAGISAGTANGEESEEQAREVFATNLGGVLNTVLPIIPMMKARHRGQIAIISSVAGLRGLPGAPAYSASKAAVKAWGEALRGWLHKENVHVSVVCPGFIRTPMTDINSFPMPLLMDADKAAHHILRGLEKNKSLITFPLATYLALRLLTLLPHAVTDRLLRGMPGKG